MVVDLGVGYRWFREKWSSGTELTMGGFGEFRAGVGADIRVNRGFSLSPMLTFSSGSFTERGYLATGSAEKRDPVPCGIARGDQPHPRRDFDVGGT